MEKNKKIGIVFYKFASKNFSSGGEKVNFLIIQALFELGYKIDLFCDFSDATEHEYIENFYVGNGKQEIFNKNKENYEFTLSNGLFAITDYSYVHENSRGYRTQVVRSKFENFFAKILNYSRYKKMLNEIESEKKQREHIKKFLVPSVFLKKDLTEIVGIPKEKIFIIPPPISFPENFVKKQNDIFTFGLVARGFDVKGGWLFICGLLNLKFRNIKFKVKIICSNKRKNLEFICKIMGLSNRIEFIDFQEDINEFYQNIDCLVMPSKRESFGMVAAEAALRKIPIIVSSRCGIKDYIEDGENGFIFNFEFTPIRNLVKKMVYVTQNQDKLEAITNNAYEGISKLDYEFFKKNLKMVIEKN